MKEKPIIFLVSHDRYTCLKKVINRLVSLGQDRIVIVDTKSTYEPLLEFYKEIKNTFDIIRMSENYRARVALSRVYSEFKDKYNLDRDNYIHSGDDIVLSDECPEDFVELFSKIMEKYHVEVVAPALRIDNLPDCFAGKSFIINQQKHWWEPPVTKDFGIELKFGGCDVFSYMRANSAPTFASNACRTHYPYVADHLPWYVDSNNLSEEDKYYFKTASPNFSTYLRDMGNKWQLPPKWRRN